MQREPLIQDSALSYPLSASVPYTIESEAIYTQSKDAVDCDDEKYFNDKYPKFGFKYSKCDWILYETDRIVKGNNQHYVELTSTKDKNFKLMFLLYPWYPAGGFSFIVGNSQYNVLPYTRIVRYPKIMDWPKIDSEFDYEYNLVYYEESVEFVNKCPGVVKYCGPDPAYNFKTEYIESGESIDSFFHIIVNSNNNNLILQTADEVVDTVIY